MRSKVIIFIVLALLLTSCGGTGGEGAQRDTDVQMRPNGAGSDLAQDPTGDGTQVPDEPAAGDGPDQPEPAARDIRVLMSEQNRGKGFGADNGFYYITQNAVELADGRDAFCLMYVDYASRREVYLCADPACRHDTADCTAVLPLEDFQWASVFAMGDRLYILVKEPDRDGVTVMGGSSGGAAETEPAALYSMGLDGTGRERIYTFGDNLTVESFAAGDGEGLFFITKRITSASGAGGTYFTSTQRELIYLDLATGQASAVLSMDRDGGVSWDPVGSHGRELIMYGTDFGREVTPEDLADRSVYSDADDVFAAVDVDTGGVREIFRVHGVSSRSWTVGERELYFAADGGAITAVDLETGGTRELPHTDNTGICMVLAGRLCLWGAGGESFRFMDADTGEVTRCGLNMRSTGHGIRILAQAGDLVLVIYDEDITERSDGSYVVNSNSFALIGSRDLFNGVDGFKPVEMAGKGI